MEKPKWYGPLVRACLNNAKDEIQAAIELGLPLKEYLDINYEKNFTALHYACDQGASPPIVQALIDAGSDVNAWTKPSDTYGNNTVLMLAAKAGQPEVVKLLLAAGADPQAAYRNPRGGSRTALVSACMGGKGKANELVLKLLLKAGTKPDANCLVWASRKGSPAMVRMIIDAGVDVNDVSQIPGWGSALHCAVGENRPDNVEALLLTGARPTIVCPSDHKNYPNQSALDLARAKKLRKLIPMLEAAAKGIKLTPIPPPPPPTVKDLPNIWKQLKKALPAGIKRSLQKPASDAALKEAQAAIREELPADLLLAYSLHNGQKDGADGLFPEGFARLDAEFVLLPVECVLREWKLQSDLLAAGEFRGQTSIPDAGVCADWWNRHWLPFASDGGGDFLCIDLAPAEKGTAGQVICFRHDSGERSLLAPSLTAFLANLAEHWAENSD